MYTYRCKVIKIVDGDTVDVDIDLGFGVWLSNQRIRFDGIDAPESRTSDAEEKIFGNLAKEFVYRMLPLDSYQTLVSKEYNATGKYGRIIGDFLVYDLKTDGERKLTEIMIREHHAVAYNGGDRDLLEEAHLQNRQALREAGIV